MHSAALDRRIVPTLVAGISAAALAYDPSAPAAAPKRLAALLLCVLAVGLVLGRELRSRRSAAGDRVPVPALLLAIVAAWWSVTLLWGAPSGIPEVGTWVAGATLALVASRMPQYAAERALELAAIVIGTLTALVMLTQFALGVAPTLRHGGHGNPDWAGLVLALGLLPSCGLAVRLRQQGRRAFALAVVAIAIELLALALARSRTAWLAVGLGAAVAAVGPRRPRVTAATVSVGVFAVATALTLPPVTRVLWSGQGEPMAEPARGLGGRAWIGMVCADAALRHAPLGAGAGRFGHAYLAEQGRRLGELPLVEASRRFHNARSAHSDWLESAAVAGVPALGLLALALSWSLFEHLKSRRRWLSGATAITLVCATGDCTLARPAAMLLTALLLATNDRTLQLPGGGRLRWPLALGLCAWLLTESARGFIAARWVTEAQASPPLERAAQLEAAAALDPRSGQAALELGLMRSALGDPRGAIDALKRSQPLLANVGTEIALANAYVARGELGRAEEALQRALLLHPASFRAHANLAVVSIRLGALARASAHLRSAQQLWPGHPRLPAIAEQLRHAELDRTTGGPPDSG